MGDETDDLKAEKLRLEVRELEQRTSLFVRVVPWMVAAATILGLLGQYQIAAIDRAKSELAIEKLEHERKKLAAEVAQLNESRESALSELHVIAEMTSTVLAMHEEANLRMREGTGAGEEDLKVPVLINITPIGEISSRVQAAADALESVGAVVLGQ